MRRASRFAFAPLLLLALASPSLAEDWPTHPVRVIVAYPPGSTPDLTARLVTPGLSEAFGQPFVVDNRSGAGGVVTGLVTGRRRPTSRA